MPWQTVLTMLCTLALLGGGPALSQARTFEFSKEGFRLELPERWVRIPADVFGKRMERLKEAYGKSKSMIAYRHALQLESKDWFSYPYILISFWEDTRVETEEVPEMNARLKEHLLQEGDGIQGTALREASYNPDRRLFRIELEFTMAERRLVLLKAVRYMDRNVAVFNAYIPKPSYAEFAPEVAAALDSLRIDPERAYRPGASGGLDFKRDVLPYLKISIATGIALLVLGVLLWKRRRNARSDR